MNSAPQQDYFAMNQSAWDRRAEVHFGSKFYDVEGFLAGNSSLREIERAELSDVAGRRLLHLQCHFGLDTLSWARLGAKATGVDLSPVAIARARELAARTGLNAGFVCSNVLDFDRGDAEPFDIVFTSYGAVCWLPDIRAWAEVVSRNLASGGCFYMVEFHPIYDLISGYSYFTRNEPDIEEGDSYTENGQQAQTRSAVWSHPISAVTSALIEQGIEIEAMREYPFSPYNCFKGMQEREPGRFYLQHLGQDVPLVYSLRGRKRH
ncbi:class I SAM-dependent methyltransferase [Pseudomarimonas arenosa]|uniref:Methyltransferase domain-containing protein n=1 Tax=Pseudomarimonas arenosa TaxID=2774145 RepID=A0AAW3ZSW9_9GAMM|nr:class I SAM-dependent methyltransferase [Pseudomarimonas arenosa]MBD8528099.1 methyltransferase domain-containing protein [Pseudomarimonas arenosa]